MKAHLAILRNLSLGRIQSRPPVTVAPLLEKTRFDQQLTAELDSLRPQGANCEPEFTSATWLVQLLDASIATQKIALEPFVKMTYRDGTDRKALDEYLESNIEILDACNYFVEKIEIIKQYLGSLRVVLRLVDGSCKPNGMAARRALDHLESCRAIERKSKVMGKRGSSLLRKTLRQKLAHETEFGEIMCGSKAMASMACRFLELGLSFDSKRRLPTRTQSQSQTTSSCWLGLLQELANLAEGSEKLQKRRSGSCLMMSELQKTVSAAWNLQEQIKGKREKELKSAVEGVKRSCREMEDGLELIEERVKDLYKNLIDVRMGLLGILSQA